MKVRRFPAPVLLASVAVLALLVPVGVRPLAAQASIAAKAAVSPFPHQDQVAGLLRSAPLMFVENVGQFSPVTSGTSSTPADGIRFQVRARHATLHLAEDALWLTVLERPSGDVWSARAPGAPGLFKTEYERRTRRGVNLKVSFAEANPHPRLEPLSRLNTRVSTLIGGDLGRRRGEVPAWRGVRYVDLYPGLDLELTGEDGRWAWRLVCRQADCQAALWGVRLRVEGVDALSLDGDRLRLSTALGESTLPLLQVTGARGTSLACPTVRGDQVTWPFVSPSPKPQSDASDLLYGSFLGGMDEDHGFGVALDGAGNIYVMGSTESPDFPTTPGAFDTDHSNVDTFVVKINAADMGLVYATFLGGSNQDEGRAIAVDEAGNAYVTGWTNSSDFPVTPGAFDTSLEGGTDAFVAKLNPAGTGLAYATLLGGSSGDRAWGIAVDGTGSAYVTGDTSSSDFPTTPGVFDTSYNGHMDAFVVKVNPAGAELAYATFLGGGSDWDGGSAIAVDGDGSAYVTGHTESSDFPTTPGAFDSSYNGWDAFVVKFNSAGTGLEYASFLGGGAWEWGGGIAVDGAGGAYVTGVTMSSDFPTTPGAFEAPCGAEDAFVAKVKPDGKGLAYATCLGGSQDEGGSAIAVDGAGNAYVTGYTQSFDFPITDGAFDTGYDGGRMWGDAYLVRVNTDGTGLTYATFLGGDAGDWARAADVDGAGNAYLVGSTQSSGFPTTARALDTHLDGGYDAFMVKINTGEVTPTPTPVPPPVALVNGSFEDGFYPWQGHSIANGWAPYALAGEPTLAGERTTAHSGRWAYKVSGYAPFSAGLAQVVGVQPGGTYRVTAYYQLYPPGDGQAFLGIQDGSSPPRWVGDSWPGVWRPLSQVITVTSDRLLVSLQGSSGPDPNTNVYFDDVSVVAIGSP